MSTQPPDDNTTGDNTTGDNTTGNDRAGDNTTGELTLREWAVGYAPGSHPVAASEPEAVLLAHNLIAVGRSVDAVREIVLEWERIREPDVAVGFVALASTPPGETPAPSGADPEHVAGHTAAKVLRGAVPGALVGGAVIALVVLIIDGWDTAVLGALAGGAAFGAVAGAVLSFAMGTGWGAAYTESFVAPSEADLAIASIHGHHGDFLDDAASAVPEPAAVRLIRVDASGREVGGTGGR